MATNTAYYKTSHTGGGLTALDGEDGAKLNDADFAFVLVSDITYVYKLSATSGAAESSPNVISPDTNAGNKRWILQVTHLPDGSVALAKLADMATASLLGRNTAAVGVPEVLSKATALSLLNVADGAIANLVEDATPQLGGDLDTNSKNINAIKQTNVIENESKLLQTEDIFSDFVVTGLLPATSVDLISDISAGHAYVTGTRVNKAATSKTYTASKDTYVDVNSAGTYTFVEVALGAAAPAVTADSIRLAKVVTDVDNITGVTDLRKLTLTLPAPTVILTGGQIAFPATAVPSADPNTLDDYEEGEFIVTMGAGTSGTITIDTTSDTLAYTKAGRIVTISGRPIVSSVSSPVGRWNLIGLPFVCANLGEAAGKPAFVVAFSALGTSQIMVIATASEGASDIYIEAWTGTAAESMADHVAANTVFTLGGCYMTT